MWVCIIVPGLPKANSGILNKDRAPQGKTLKKIVRNIDLKMKLSRKYE